MFDLGSWLTSTNELSAYLVTVNAVPCKLLLWRPVTHPKGLCTLFNFKFYALYV
jgi:hypothetical protein